MLRRVIVQSGRAALRSQATGVSRPAAGLFRIPATHFSSTTSDDAKTAAAADPEAAAVDPHQFVVKGPEIEHQFQAETSRLLGIVANSLYTDKEVFVRELVSNASDALEKMRHRMLAESQNEDSGTPLEIRIDLDDVAGTFTITDTGIGMTEKELIANLGTIARSGSKEFMEKLTKDGKVSKPDIIGQFGVGFYSAFMVSDEVKVWSKSAALEAGGHVWSTDGKGHFRVAPVDGAARGTRIHIKLRPQEKTFANPDTVRRIVEKYSNFVGFPIYVNGKKVNNVGAIWRLPKNEVTPEQHSEFYRFISNGFDEPLYSFQFATDMPFDLRAVLYVPSMHMEKYGMGRMSPGVSVFARKVLIQSKMQGLLPEWLRFIRGVVESEDIPLHISREHMQDSALIKRLGSVLTKRVIRFLADEAKRDAAAYNKFFVEFGSFVKEGILTDENFKEELGPLLRYESSSTGEGALTSLDEYLERATKREGEDKDKPAAADDANAKKPEDDVDIYYLVASSRTLAESSPYYESFKAQGVEVLFLYNPIEDFVMNSLVKYRGHNLVSIEKADLKINKKKSESKDDKEKSESTNDANALSADQKEQVKAYIKTTLGERVSEVKITDRKMTSPCIITDHEASAHRVRRMMGFTESKAGLAQLVQPQKLEINADHPVIVSVGKSLVDKDDRNKMIVEQMFDNALVAAGLMDDPRVMIGRINSLLEFIAKEK